MDRWSFFFRRAPAPASEPASLKSPSRSSSKPHATLPNLLLESVQGDQLSLARRLAELELALEVLVNKKNPAATPLLDMLASLAAQHLAALSSETALPGTFEEEIEALRAVVDLQLSRSLQEEEKADFKLTVNVLYPVSDSELEEICLKNINPKRELGFLREKVAEAMGCESNRVYLRFAGEILGQDKDDLELKTILKKEHGDFLMNAFRKSQAKFLGFEEDVSEDSQENQGFIIRVNVPSAGDVEEYVIENLDMGTDLGEIRESIAELVGTDSKFLILKHQGKFLRPSEDYMRLHEIFRLADGSGVLKEAQLTAYTKQVAIELGQVDDYFAELIAKPQTGGKEPPVGGVAIPFLQKIQSRSSLLLELHNDEERAAVERFIKEQREKKSKKVPDVTEDKSEHRLEIPSLKKELSAGQALETNIRPSEASIPEVPSVPVPPPPPPPSIAPIAPPPPPPTAPMAPPSIAPPPPTTAIRAPEAPAALSKPIESRCKMLHWDKINLKGS